MYNATVWHFQLSLVLNDRTVQEYGKKTGMRERWKWISWVCQWV